MDALIIVDLQKDFCSGGALAVPDGEAVIELVNELARDAPYVVATRDWHPAAHGSFRGRGGRWPEHCVQGTPGAELHARFDQRLIDVLVSKGEDADTEGYSGFDGTELEGLLQDQNVRHVDVVGLALDYCVKSTALDARGAGFEVTVHLAGTRAVEVAPGDGERAVAELRAAGVKVLD